MAAASQVAFGQEKVTWEECVIYAHLNNPALKSSLEAVSKSRAATGVARSAYLPQISASAAANTAKSFDNSKTANKEKITWSQSQYIQDMRKSDSTITNSFSYGVSGKQLIFDSMKTIYDIKAAESAADDSLLQYHIKSSLVRLELRTAFVKLLKAQDAVNISKQIIEIRKKNYNLVKMRYQAGREHKGSLLNAEANLEQAKYTMKQAERNIIAAQRALLNVMGIYSHMDIRAQGNLLDKTAVKEKPDFNSIVKSHPSVLSARKQREAAGYMEKSKIASFLPVISATGSADRTISETTGSKTDAVNLKAGLSATMPLFTGGNNYYNLEQAKAQSRKLKADEETARDQVLTDLQQKWIDWQNAIDAVEVQRKYLAAAEERARIAEAEYSLGLVVFDIWIQIEDQLVQMKQSYLDAQANRLLAEAQWIQSKGETLAYDK
ncbi:MAG: TolC family protein [Spirochaetes bacterium]|nr:TolC family protein [Spirochaetota bacterium]